MTGWSRAFFVQISIDNPRCAELLADGYEIIQDPLMPVKPWFANWWSHRPVLLRKIIEE